jgi:hypothetical protein
MLWSSIIFMFSNDLIKKKLKKNLELSNNNKSFEEAEAGEKIRC